uniref:Movement protein n=1 Tax=Wheat dwarf India virus TaxID=1174526 RepID=A0A7D5YHA3_9GEMI|nr:movement protein [Wheat dwarf India virus]
MGSARLGEFSPLAYPGSIAYIPQSPPAVQNEDPWIRLVFVFVAVIAAIGLLYLSYRWFVKDVIILLRAKRQRSTEEIGFGNDPSRIDGGQPSTRRGPDPSAAAPPY